MCDTSQWLFRRMECPECKSPIDSTALRRNDRQRVEYGLLDCACATYPVVAGVAVLRTDALTQTAAEHVASREFETARSVLLNLPGRVPGRSACGTVLSRLGSAGHPAVRALAAYHRASGRSDEEVGAWRTFEDAATALVGSDDPGFYFDEYLTFRPLEQSFWNLHALLPLFHDAPGPLLDFAGGAGHASDLVARTTGTRTCTVDVNFRTLFLYTRFVNRQQPAVVIGEGADLPFFDDAFGTTLNVDGLHFVPNRFAMSGELERVTAADGLVALLHQHTDDQARISGTALPTAEQTRGFDREAVVVPERDVVEPFVRAVDEGGGSIELHDRRDGADGGDVNVLFGADVDDDTVDIPVERRVHPLLDWAGPVTVNHAYEVTTDGGSLHLERRPLSPVFREEFDRTMAHTDEAYVVSLDDVDARRSLLARGVLTVLPERYVGRPVVGDG
ncbi:class I SAM-dependent methyltransferase [Halomarina litorea]|uniref:class I SAM-dependent methyltransferase n=1 Tax=Halomarina litorea TaxID=2961595 RepID=UPI0020C3071F|nr:methyltransferase domain-containing protein [Halomarina sp. BCD28]